MALSSLWQDRHPRPLLAPPDVQGRYDVVVVGAGLTGLTTAVLLARAGRSVLVLEAERLGHGTTGRSTAKISLLQGTRLSAISRRHPEAVLRRYVEANTEAQAWLLRFCGDHGVPTQDRSAFTYAHSESGIGSVRDEHDLAQAMGLPVEWHARLDLPFTTRGGTSLPHQAQLDPVTLLDTLADQARGLGAEIVEGARVLRVRGSGPTSVTTQVGVVEAEHVVVATNMPILDRGAFFARMSPQRSYGLALRTPVPAVEGMYLSADAPSRSLREAPAEDGSILLVGGAGHATGRVRSPLEHLDGLREWARTCFPEAQEEVSAWSAQDYVPAGELPFTGPVLPGADHLLVAGGYAKWGMTNGVAAALALTAGILGDRPSWASVFDTARAGELRGLPTLAKSNAAVGLEMAAGWLRPLPNARHVDEAPAEGAGRVAYDRVGPPTASSTVDGVVRRVSGVCTHLGGVVRWNDAETSWDCPLHGSRFDADGAVLEGPATCGLTRVSRSG